MPLQKDGEMKIEMEPWVDIPTARCVLRWLVVGGEVAGNCLAVGEMGEFNRVDRLADWLTEHGLGALAYGRTTAATADLRACLQGDMFSAAAESSLKQTGLQAIMSAFAQAEIPLALLKGAALSLTVYEDPAWRTMSDIDLWLPDEDVAAAARVMAGLGYQIKLKDERPLALQTLSRGEIKFFQPNKPASLVEFHWSPFPGWWLMRTAVIDEPALWQRREPLPASPSVCQVAPEDMVIHLAVHTAVNHQFGMSALRSLVDIALTTEKRDVDWVVVAERAKTWRVATAVYTVLDLVDKLIGLDGLDQALPTLQPSSLRLRFLRQFVTPESVLAGRDISTGFQRFMLLLLLVDRKRDIGKLIFRTLWPEPVWLQARYGENVGHMAHVWRMIRRREI